MSRTQDEINQLCQWVSALSNPEPSTTDEPARRGARRALANRGVDFGDHELRQESTTYVIEECSDTCTLGYRGGRRGGCRCKLGVPVYSDTLLSAGLDIAWEYLLYRNQISQDEYDEATQS